MSSFGAGGKSEDRHELRHEVHLAAALQHIHALFRGDDRIAIEIGRALLELGEVLDRFQGPLRAEQPLDVHAPQAWGCRGGGETPAAGYPHQMRGAVGMAVDMAVEAGNAQAGLFRAPVIGGVELLLGKGRDQQPQAFELLGFRCRRTVRNSCPLSPLCPLTHRPDRAAWSGKWLAEIPAGNGRADRSQGQSASGRGRSVS